MQQTKAYHTKFICLIFLEFFFTGIHDIIKYLEKYETDTWTTSEYLSCLKFLFRVVLGRHTLRIPVQ